ncbi:MAG: hypothetical protein RSA04_04745 [Clostridiales bacterium]
MVAYKDKIAQNWQIKCEYQKIDKNQWRFGTKDKSVLVTGAKEKDPYLSGRMEFWQYLAENQGEIAAAPLKDKNGAIVLETHKACYFAREEVKAKSVDFGSADTLKAAAVTLGKLHKIARDFDWTQYCLPQKNPLRYLHRMEKLMDDGEKALSKSKKTREYNDALIKRSEESLFLLCDGTLDNLKDNLVENGDFVYGKINCHTLMRTDNKIKLTDLSYMAEDLAIMDLWQLFRRYLKDTTDSGTKIWEALELYQKENPLNSQEKRALMGFLLFPYDIYRIAVSEKKKDELEKIIAKEDKREKLYMKIYKRGAKVENENSH